MRYLVKGVIDNGNETVPPRAFSQEISANTSYTAGEMVKEQVSKGSTGKVTVTHIWGLVNYPIPKQTEAEYYSGKLLVVIEEMLELHDAVIDIQTKRNWIAATFGDKSTVIITVQNNDLTK